ncbi:T-complex protein 1 subunit alpha [Camellia lanceoleosa]|uniref:T-complex protein 1 subunit alpha n=1 Tax=Camellia lanceoleosa TaxID=1840588 RepID=A0ACC0H918_9ERIC|nr:T-complex protein 1 subunit alpha [Camellia lanceoleosa]
MLVDDIGDVTITNDGAIILKILDVEHPAAKSSDPADNDAWKDKGTSQLSINCKDGVNKGTREFKPTILV